MPSTTTTPRAPSAVQYLFAHDALTPREQALKKQYLNMIFRRKDNLLKKVHELFTMANNLKLPKTKVQASFYLYGRYYIYNSEDNKGPGRDWFPTKEDIVCSFPAYLELTLCILICTGAGLPDALCIHTRNNDTAAWLQGSAQEGE
jgi:hypothetical protein